MNLFLFVGNYFLILLYKFEHANEIPILFNYILFLKLHYLLCLVMFSCVKETVIKLFDFK